MRVVTQFGFGIVGSLPKQGTVAVLLDVAHIGQKRLLLDRIQEVFLFSDWAVIRVLNVTASGWFSNIQFYPNREEAERELTVPTPPDETRFFLDTATYELKKNRLLGVPAQDIMWLQPWLDRWGMEDTRVFEDLSSAKRRFAEERQRLAGTGGGIWTQCLLNIKKERIEWFCIAVPPPLGVIWEKKYVYS